MTKFILHGGMAGIPCKNNKKFIKEIINSAEGPVKILLVLFAAEKEKWSQLEEEHRQRFLSEVGNKKIEFRVASEDTEEFIQQIFWCNVIYIRGGATPILQTYLEKVTNLRELINNKVVAGSSAGALVFAKYYYDQDYPNGIYEGLDFLHVKMFTHYKSYDRYVATSGEDKLQQLENYKEKLPIYAIPETEFVIIEK